MALHMRKATEADLQGIAQVGVAAFSPATDAIVRHLFPDQLRPAEPSQEEAMTKWRYTRKGIKRRTENILLMVVTDDALGGQVVGFSMWELPTEAAEGAPPSTSEYKPVVPCLGLDESAYNELRKVSGQATKDCFGETGHKKLWYLDFLGVHPSHQRRGIGKMLLDWGVQEAHKEKKDAFLIATPAGVPLYEARGFEEMKTFPIFAAPHVVMIRRYAEQ